MKRLSIALAVLAAGAAFAQSPATPSTDWPRVIGVENGSVEIFQPQIESFQGDQLAARAAVAWTPNGRPPAFGVVWVEARVSIDKVAGDVSLQDVKVQRVRFANMSKEQEQQGRALLEREIPTWDLHLSVLELEASIAVNEQEIQTSEALDFTPPRMVFSQEPAVLLVFDGAPIERPVESTELRRVVNTPMLVLFDPATRSYYLSGGKFWYAAPAATGPYAPVAAPSPAVRAPSSTGIPRRPSSWRGIRRSRRPRRPCSSPPRRPGSWWPPSPPSSSCSRAPRSTGRWATKPTCSTSPTPRATCSSTCMSGETYVLASGRWFRAPSLDGPWVNVPPDELPGPFGDIPPDSDIGDVRTFVAGTEEAADAVADSLIPQTAEVRRDQQFQAAYDGPPQFQKIEGTELSYAVNTPDAVVLDAGRYWACDQGVWYTAPAAEGPFVVADQRPPHIDQVPPTVHIYHTRYVYVYRSTPQVVFVGHTPGFVGVYRHRGVVVFGTGFVYRPWIGPTVFFARPTTFGVRVVYNPWTGFGFVVSPATPFIDGRHPLPPRVGTPPAPAGLVGAGRVPSGVHRPAVAARLAPAACRASALPPSGSSSATRRPAPARLPPAAAEAPGAGRPAARRRSPPRSPAGPAPREQHLQPGPESSAQRRAPGGAGPAADPAAGGPAQQRVRRPVRKRLPPERPGQLGPEHPAGMGAPASHPPRSPSPGTPPGPRPLLEPVSGHARPQNPGQTARPTPGQPTRRPTPGQPTRQAPPPGQNRGGSAPAGLGQDAAARQRSAPQRAAPQPARPAPQPARAAPAGGGAGGRR